jgi:serralysin
MARRGMLLVMAALVLCPASASASEATLRLLGTHTGRAGFGGNYEFSYTVDSGEANRLSLTYSGSAVRVEDAGATIRAGEGCTAEGAAVVCDPELVAHTLGVRPIDLGDRDDETLTRIHTTLRGGDGNDTLRASSYVDGGPGADRIIGEGEFTVLDYSERTAGVRATFDGVANDGEAGEGDDVSGVFRAVQGGSGDDVLESSNLLFDAVLAGPGDDHVIGSPGNDSLHGGPGDDLLEGNDGDDELYGGDDADRSRGGTGIDTWASGREDVLKTLGPGVPGLALTPDDQPNDGQPGEGDDVGSDIENLSGSSLGDHITGTDGPNVIHSVGGADTVLALGGDDTIVFDAGRKTIDAGAGRDTVATPVDDDALRLRDGEPDSARCAAAARPAISADPIDALTDCRSFLRFSQRSQRLPVSSTDTVALRARCVRLADDRCRGRLRLYRRVTTRLLASGFYSVPAGQTRSVRLRLSSGGRRLLERPSSIRFVATASPTGHLLPPAAAHARGTLVRRR